MALYYIRLLKPPPQTCVIDQPFTIVWTIESDLGDCSYMQAVPVACCLEPLLKVSDLRLEMVRDKTKVAGHRQADKTVTKSNVDLVYDPYSPGGNVSKLVFRGRSAESTEIRLALKLAGSARTGDSHSVWSEAFQLGSQEESAWIIPVFSVPLNVTAKRGIDIARGHEVERVIKATDGSNIRIREEVAESIARHVWDCGLGMCDYLARLVSSRSVDFNHKAIIELGSGTGLVGIYAAKLLNPEHVYLTDLPEALQIMKLNARYQTRTSKILVKPLEWGPKQSEAYQWLSVTDLVLLTDVLYNQASHDALIATLDWLVPSSKTTKVLLAYKQRNPDERVFFQKLVDVNWAYVQIEDPALTCEMYWLIKKEV